MVLPTKTIIGVELLAVGTWHGVGCPDAGCVLKTQHLDQMAEAHRATVGKLDPPVKLGHNHSQELLKGDGLPAAGWVTNLRRVGGKLLGDLRDVPSKVAELIESGAFRKRSAEFMPNMTVDGKKYPLVFTGLALLGAEIPAVQTLDDIRSLYQSMQLSLDDATRVVPSGWEIAMVEWTTAFINDLPDGAFAGISTGGSTDGTGKTAPRTLRHLPHHDNSALDLPHLRNALQRLRQVRASESLKRSMLAHLQRHARTAGVGEDMSQALREAEEAIVDEKELRKLLGIDDDADISAHVTTLQTGAAKTGEGHKTALKERDDQIVKLTEKVATLEKGEDGEPDIVAMRTELSDTQKRLTASVQEITALQEKGVLADAERVVDAAISEGRILPAQKEVAMSFATSDMAKFGEFVAAQPDNLVDLSERGHGGDNADLTKIEPTAMERDIAEQMGVGDDPEHRIAMMKARAADQHVRLPADFGKSKSEDGDK